MSKYHPDEIITNWQNKREFIERIIIEIKEIFYFLELVIKMNKSPMLLELNIGKIRKK